MNVRFKMTEEEYENVVTLEKKTKDKNISRCLKVLNMRYESFTCQAIAEHLAGQPYEKNQENLLRMTEQRKSSLNVNWSNYDICKGICTFCESEFLIY